MELGKIKIIDLNNADAGKYFTKSVPVLNTLSECRARAVGPPSVIVWQAVNEGVHIQFLATPTAMPYMNLPSQEKKRRDIVNRNCG